jgi:hypothetical protein
MFTNIILTALLSFMPVLDGPTVNALGWAPGDTANYQLKVSFINGSMDMTIRSQEADGYWWVDQVADLGFAGEQKIEILINPGNGKIKKLIVNGKEQDPPSPEDFEVVEMKEDSVNVPAGTFDAIYIKTKNDSGQESESWINNDLIPIFGLLKQLAPTQMGQLDMQLKSYNKN